MRQKDKTTLQDRHLQKAGADKHYHLLQNKSISEKARESFRRKPYQMRKV